LIIVPAVEHRRRLGSKGEGAHGGVDSPKSAGTSPAATPQCRRDARAPRAGEGTRPAGTIIETGGPRPFRRHPVGGGHRQCRCGCRAADPGLPHAGPCHCMGGRWQLLDAGAFGAFEPLRLLLAPATFLPGITASRDRGRRRARRPPAVCNGQARSCKPPTRTARREEK